MQSISQRLSGLDVAVYGTPSGRVDERVNVVAAQVSNVAVYQNEQKQKEQLTIPSQQEFPSDSYPEKYVHSVFENEQDAVQAVQALRAAGYYVEDIHFMMSQDYEQAVRRGNQPQVGESPSHFASSLDYDPVDVYLNEARRGRHILSVRISNHDQVMQVRNILTQHHGELIKYIDTWAQADLSNSTTHGDW